MDQQTLDRIELRAALRVISIDLDTAILQLDSLHSTAAAQARFALVDQLTKMRVSVLRELERL